MAKRYFGVNSCAGVFRTSANVKEVTTAGTFDATYVSNGILVPQGGIEYAKLIGPFLDGSNSIAGTVYVRFDNNNVSYNTGGPVLLMMNGGVNAYQIQAAGGADVQVQYWNSGTAAWVNWGPLVPVAVTLNTMVLEIQIGVGFTLYQGGTPVASSAVAPVNGAAAVDEFRFFASKTTADSVYSQLMAADYDLRDAHLFSRLATGEGTYATDGTGAYTDINEMVLDEGTAIQLPTSLQHRTFIKGGIVVPVGLTIAGMVINARGRIGGTITDGKLLCKQGASDSLSTGRGFNSGYEPRSAFFATDPLTGGAWSQAGYNSAEFGFAAV